MQKVHFFFLLFRSAFFSAVKREFFIGSSDNVISCQMYRLSRGDLIVACAYTELLWYITSLKPCTWFFSIFIFFFYLFLSISFPCVFIIIYSHQRCHFARNWILTIFLAWYEDRWLDRPMPFDMEKWCSALFHTQTHTHVYTYIGHVEAAKENKEIFATC